MQATFTRAPAETERKETGIGGKPPVDRRPTGGGGGGGDDDWKSPRGGPRTLLNRARFVVFSVMAADLVFFAVLAAIFFARQSGIHLDAGSASGLAQGEGARGSAWSLHLSFLPKILYLNTFVLLLSSLTLERARQNIFDEIDVLEEWLGLGQPAMRKALPWLGATFGLGVLFLCGQMAGWAQLTARGFAMNQSSTPASYFFYLMTGIHGLQVALGALALLGCLCGLGWLKRVDHRQIAVDATAWYWHCMNLTWLVLLAMLAVG